MKKIIFLLLTAATFATLAACGGGGESTEDPLRSERVSLGDVLVYESRQAIRPLTVPASSHIVAAEATVPRVPYA